MQPFWVGQGARGPDRFTVGGVSYKFRQYNQGLGGACMYYPPDPTGVFSQTSQVQPRVAQFLPDVAIVANGGNDLAGNYPVRSLAQIMLDDAAQLAEWVTQLQAYSAGRQCRLLYALVTPPLPGLVITPAQWLAFQNNRRALVAAAGSANVSVTLVDFYTDMAGGDGLMLPAYYTSGHPNQAGYDKMSELLFAAWAPFLPTACRANGCGVLGTVLPMGDSGTQGVGSDDDGGWRSGVEKLMIAAF